MLMRSFHMAFVGKPLVTEVLPQPSTSMTTKSVWPIDAVKRSSAHLRLLTFKGSTNILRNLLLRTPELGQCRNALDAAGHCVQPGWCRCAIVLLYPSQMAIAEHVITSLGQAQPRRHQVVTNIDFEGTVLNALRTIPRRQGRPWLASSVCMASLVDDLCELSGSDNSTTADRP